MPAQRQFMVLGLFVALGALSACGGGAPNQSETKVEKAQVSAAQEAAGYMEQAVIAESEGDMATAFANYREAAAVFDKAGMVTVERAEAHFLAAEKALTLSQFEAAVEHYDAAIQIYLRFEGNSKAKAAVALTNMGAAYKKLGEKDKARGCWNRALEIYGDLPAEMRSSANIATIEQNLRELDINM